MAGKQVTAKLIEEYLDRRGWKEHKTSPVPQGPGEAVLAKWRSTSGEGFALIIVPAVEVNSLIFLVGEVVSAKPDSTPADRLSGLLLTIGRLNHVLVLGSWGFNPGDGSLGFRVSVPIDDGEISFENFDHCVRAVIVAIEADAGNLRAIAAGTKSAIEVLKAEGATIG